MDEGGAFLMSETIKVMLPEEEISARVKQLGEQISQDYEGGEIVLVCILKGACLFMCDLARCISLPVSMEFMTVSSYGAGTVSSGDVQIKYDIEASLEGKDIIIVEDIIDSGRTLDYLGKVFVERGAKSVKMCTLLDKSERREVEVAVDYVGFTIPDAFVVGYGLDYDQKYRNLPYIGVLSFD